MDFYTATALSMVPRYSQFIAIWFSLTVSCFTYLIFQFNYSNQVTNCLSDIMREKVEKEPMSLKN